MFVPAAAASNSMESLFYALGILLSGALIFHFFSQFGISLWLIYFIVAKMWPFMSSHQPWDPIQDKIDEAINNTIGNLPSLCDVDLIPRKKWKNKHGPSGLCEEDGWEGDPLSMSIITGFNLVMCLLLLLWVSWIFAKVIRLGRRQQGSAVRTVLHLSANRLATPAFAASIGMSWYLVYGCWVWVKQCRPLTTMSWLNFANALMLTVPAAVFTVAWVVGTGCEIASHVRTERQNDIPLPNLAPPDPQNPLDRLFANQAAAALAAPGGGGNNVSTTLLLLQFPRPLCLGTSHISLWAP